MRREIKDHLKALAIPLLQGTLPDGTLEELAQYRDSLESWHALRTGAQADKAALTQLMKEIRAELQPPSTKREQLFLYFFNSFLPPEFTDDPKLNYSEEFMRLAQEQPNEKEDAAAYGRAMNCFACAFNIIGISPCLVEKNDINAAKYVYFLCRATWHGQPVLMHELNDFLSATGSNWLNQYYPAAGPYLIDFIWNASLSGQSPRPEELFHAIYEEKEPDLYHLYPYIRFHFNNVIVQKILKINDLDVLSRIITPDSLLMKNLMLKEDRLTLIKNFKRKIRNRVAMVSLLVGQASADSESYFSRLPHRLCLHIISLSVSSENFIVTCKSHIYFRWASLPRTLRPVAMRFFEYRCYFEFDINQRRQRQLNDGRSEYKSCRFTGKNEMSIRVFSQSIHKISQPPVRLEKDLVAVNEILIIFIGFQEKQKHQMVTVGYVNKVITHKNPQGVLACLNFLIKQECLAKNGRDAGKLSDKYSVLSLLLNIDIAQLCIVFSGLEKIGYCASRYGLRVIIRLLNRGHDESYLRDFVTVVNFCVNRQKIQFGYNWTEKLLLNPETVVSILKRISNLEPIEREAVMAALSTLNYLSHTTDKRIGLLLKISAANALCHPDIYEKLDQENITRIFDRYQSDEKSTEEDPPNLIASLRN